MAASDELSLGTYLDEWLERRRTQLRPTTTSARGRRPAATSGAAPSAMTMDVYAHVMPAMDEDAVTRLDETIHGDTEDDGDPGRTD